jgi:cell division protein FtsB
LKNFRLFLIIFILFLIFLPGFAKLQELKAKLAETEERIRKTQRQNVLLEQRIVQLQNNTASLEMVAREKMGIVKKGETVLKIVHEDEDAPSDVVNASKE